MLEPPKAEVLIDLPSIQGGVMKVIKEMLPDLDNKGEITEVQVLEEGEVFDVDAFLDSIPIPLPAQEPQCPHCMVDMRLGSIQHEDGSVFDYYRCPMPHFNTNCYVTSSKENLAQYLKAVEEQTYPVYVQIAPKKFKCECDLSMILALQIGKEPRSFVLEMS